MLRLRAKELRTACECALAAVAQTASSKYLKRPHIASQGRRSWLLGDSDTALRRSCGFCGGRSWATNLPQADRKKSDQERAWDQLGLFRLKGTCHTKEPSPEADFRIMRRRLSQCLGPRDQLPPSVLRTNLFESTANSRSSSGCWNSRPIVDRESIFHRWIQALNQPKLRVASPASKSGVQPWLEGRRNRYMCCHSSAT